MKKLSTFILLVSLVLVSITARGGKENNNEITVISREEGSGTRGAFISLVDIEEEVDGVKVDMTSENAEIVNSTSVVITTVSGNRNAIGYISLGSLNSSVKALSVDGEYPTVESVKSGKYKIARPFIVAYLALNEVSSDFLSYVMSQEGQSIIEKKGYIRVNDNGQSYSSKGLSGSITISGSSSVYPIMEVLVENYTALNPMVRITLLQSDSTTGLNDALTGASDIALSSRELKRSEVDKGLTSTTIALDGIAVIVNNENAISSLTSSEIKNIYTGSVTSWDSL